MTDQQSHNSSEKQMGDRQPRFNLSKLSSRATLQIVAGVHALIVEVLILSIMLVGVAVGHEFKTFEYVFGIVIPLLLLPSCYLLVQGCKYNKAKE